MTVFCPNCGKPNTDSATQCVACATALKPKAAGSKFKGTMMMTGLPKAGGSGPPPAGPPTPGGPPASGPPIPAPPEASPPAAQKQNLAFQATMLGPITPPGAPGAPGGEFGSGPTGHPPNAGPPQGGFGATTQQGFGAPPPAQGGFGAPPPAQGGFGAQPPAQGGFGAQPPAQGGFGAQPPAQGGFGAQPPAQGGFGAQPPAQGGFGTPPPAQGGFGAPPSGFGAPQAQAGFGGAAPQGGFSPGAPTGAPMASGSGPTKSKTGKYIAIGCGVLVMFCCISGIIYQVVCASMAATMTPTGIAPSGAAGGSGSVCARTAECCAAYLQAMNVPGTVDCNMYANMPAVAETGCQSAIDAWRAGLQAANIAVPSACQ